MIKDSEIFATGRKIHSVKEANELYKKTSIDPSSAVANHCILVYRFSDSPDKLQESYWDDREHGAGRRLLKYMRNNQTNNVAVVITRSSWGTLLGQNRFRIMEEHVIDIANQLDGDYMYRNIILTTWNFFFHSKVLRTVLVLAFTNYIR